MTRPLFPFTAMVGLETLRMALQLAAIDRRLSVLVRGDKGAGKTTAARALGQLLADAAPFDVAQGSPERSRGTPFVNLPIGATEDRLLGGLDIERALRGEPALRRGLLAEAHGGVLYVDEVNLLPDHLADTLLDAVASGMHIVEREGFSVEQDAAFVLVGSMNPEEGTLRPQLLDRFALVVDVVASMDPVTRQEAVLRRLRFDEDPIAFIDAWRDEQAALAKRLRDACARVTHVTCPADIVHHVSETICQHHVASLRADLAVVRASRALAALEGTDTVTATHVDTVLPLVLNHRVRGNRDSRPPMAPPAPPRQPEATDGSQGSDGTHERVFEPRALRAPQLVIGQTATMPGWTAAAPGHARGPVIGARQTPEPRELDPRATLAHALGSSGSPTLRADDLHEKRREPQGGTRFIFVVDASGSHAVQQRMRAVKGAVTALLDRSTRRHDEVVVIAFRGASASVVLEPTGSVDDADAALAYLPTGGRTPLADGLVCAARYVTDSSVLVLLTDGRANVPNVSDDPWSDALSAARAVSCPALVIDSETDPHARGRARELADAMRATCIAIDALEETEIVRLVGGGSHAGA
jgi:magnesium chelatase subunit D